MFWWSEFITFIVLVIGHFQKKQTVTSFPLGISATKRAVSNDGFVDNPLDPETTFLTPLEDQVSF